MIIAPLLITFIVLPYPHHDQQPYHGHHYHDDTILTTGKTEPLMVAVWPYYSHKMGMGHEIHEVQRNDKDTDELVYRNTKSAHEHTYVHIITNAHIRKYTHRPRTYTHIAHTLTHILHIHTLKTCASAHTHTHTFTHNTHTYSP